MAEAPAAGKTYIIPALRYRDARAAVAWLCGAFGFTEHRVVPDADGSIAHAQLTLGNSMVMLGAVDDCDTSDLTCQPDEAGGRSTQSSYVVIKDIDRHYDRAVAAGATIVMPIADQDYGSRLYMCRDLEGHLWSFGSYDPWAPPNSSA